MKKIIFNLALLLSVVITAASCLGNDDNDEYTYYSDAAISAFSLGTLNRYVTVEASTGLDSLVKKSVTGSNYPFLIDQAGRAIYNTDSLPVGTDAKHVICNITSKNSGLVVIKSMTSDTLNYYSSSDSIDFSEPREFRVYSTDGTQYRKYTISVNVHKEYADSFVWSDLGKNDILARMTGMRAVTANGRMFVFGCVDGATHAMSTEIGNGKTWRQATFNFNHPLAADAYRNVIVKGNTLYLLDGNTLMSSQDGDSWQAAGNVPVTQLLGAGTDKIYGKAGSRMMASADNGASWAEEPVEQGEEAMLPTQDCSALCLPVKTDSRTERMVLIGNRAADTAPGDTAAVVWGKLEEHADHSHAYSWTYYGEAENSRLPRLSPLAVTAYDEGMLAIGGNGIGGCTAKALQQIYYSRDNGLTWHDDTRYQLPEGLESSSTSFAICSDANKYLWIVCGQTGAVWRGRLNRLGWDNPQDSFTE